MSSLERICFQTKQLHIVPRCAAPVHRRLRCAELSESFWLSWPTEKLSSLPNAASRACIVDCFVACYAWRSRIPNKTLTKVCIANMMRYLTVYWKKLWKYFVRELILWKNCLICVWKIVVGSENTFVFWRIFRGFWRSFWIISPIINKLVNTFLILILLSKYISNVTFIICFSQEVKMQQFKKMGSNY